MNSRRSMDNWRFFPPLNRELLAPTCNWLLGPLCRVSFYFARNESIPIQDLSHGFQPLVPWDMDSFPWSRTHFEHMFFGCDKNELKTFIREIPPTSPYICMFFGSPHPKKWVPWFKSPPSPIPPRSSGVLKAFRSLQGRSMTLSAAFCKVALTEDENSNPYNQGRWGDAKDMLFEDAKNTHHKKSRQETHRN